MDDTSAGRTALGTLLPGLRAPVRDEAARAGRDVLAPIAREGPRGRVDRALVKSLAACGLLPALFPEDLGGTGAGAVPATLLCAIREGLAGTCPTAETTLAVQGLGTYPILLAGGEELARRWVPAVAAGDAVAAFALTEPGAGSDAAALALAAEPDGDGWRLTGEKTWISHAPEADIVTVFARTDRDAGARGVTAFAVPGDAPGLTGEHLDLVAPHALGRMVFDGVRVPADAVLGQVGHGFAVAMGTLDRFRPSVGAAAVGMGQAALDAALAHTAGRRAFGGTLADLQGVSHRLADVATRLAAARLLVYEAAAAVDAGRRATLQAAQAKLFATEVAQQAVDAAVQVHGAAGLEAGSLPGELYLEVRALRIYEGASEVQRGIIARELYREHR